MKYLAERIDVDSGGLVIADPKILGGNYSTKALRGLGYATFGVKPGGYSCNWKVLNSLNDGKSTGKGPLKVVSGAIIVIDPMFVTNEPIRPGIPGVVEVDKTGGDGTFNIEFTLVKKK